MNRDDLACGLSIGLHVAARGHDGVLDGGDLRDVGNLAGSDAGARGACEPRVEVGRRLCGCNTILTLNVVLFYYSMNIHYGRRLCG